MMWPLGHRPVVWMVCFSAVHISLLETLIRQCQRAPGPNSNSNPNSTSNSNSNSNSPGPPLGAGKSRVAARLAKLAKFSDAYHRLLCCYYAYTLVKYPLIWLLGLEALRHYRLLDCLLVGRMTFIGRTMQVGRTIGQLAAGMFLFYRAQVALLGPNHYKFYSLEFLLYDYGDILTNEIRASERGQVAGLASCDDDRTDMTYGTISEQMDGGSGSGSYLSRRSKVAALRGTVLDDVLNDVCDDRRQTATTTTTTIRYEILHENRSQLIVSRSRGEVPIGGEPPNGNFYLRNPFSSGRPEDEYILRLNRTSRSWLTLANYATFSFYYGLLMTLLFGGLINTLISGSILTKLGFELNYPSCAHWLRDVQQTSSRNRTSQSNEAPAPSYAYIYQVDPSRKLASELHLDSLPFRIPLRELQEWTAFAVLRIVYDVLENNFWYLDYFLVFLGMAFNMYLMTIDLLINARAIRARLEAIIAGFHARAGQAGYGYDYAGRETSLAMGGDDAAAEDEQQQQQLIVHRKSYAATAEQQQQQRRDHQRVLRTLHTGRRRRRGLYDVGRPSCGSPSWSWWSGCAEAEIPRVQALLLDHFNMTRDYNLYTAFFLLFSTCAWFNYTAIICFWMARARSKSVEFEFAWAEACTFLILMSLLVAPASVRTSNYRLYALVTDAMALDDNLLVSKERWSMIIQYFYPKPMYCFTLFSSVELSWLFCLKLTSWTISAILVLANFFYMYRA